MHRIPAGFPSGIPGIAEDMEGAMQQAPQFLRQSIIFCDSEKYTKLEIIHFLPSPEWDHSSNT
jgi:hypothetical protein